MSRRASDAGPGTRAALPTTVMGQVMGDWLSDLERTGNGLLKALGRRRLRLLFRQYLAGKTPPDWAASSSSSLAASDLQAAAACLQARVAGMDCSGAGGAVPAAAETLCAVLRRAAEAMPSAGREVAAAIRSAPTPVAVARAVTEGAAALCQARGAIWWRRHHASACEAAAVAGVEVTEGTRSVCPPTVGWPPSPRRGGRALVIGSDSPQYARWLAEAGARHALLVRVPEAGTWTGALAVYDGMCDEDRCNLLLALVEQARAALRSMEPGGTMQQDPAKAASELVLAVSSAASLEEVLGRVCQVVAETTAAAKCFLFLFEEEQSVLRGRAGASTEETRRLREDLTLLAQRAREAETEFPLVTNGATQSGELAALRRRGFRSVLVAPLAAHERRLGALVALARQLHAFDAGQQERLFALASQAALEIETMQLLESAQRRLTEISQLTWTGSRVSGILDPESIAQTVAQSVAGTLRVPRVALFLADAEGELQPLRRSQVGLAMVRGDALPALGHLGAEALSAQSALTIADAGAEGRAGDLLVLWMAARSLACVPMLAPEGLRGLLVVADDGPRSFGLHEIGLLSTYANQAALALQGALLYVQTARQVNRLSKLGEALEALASAKNPSQSADILLRSALELFDAPVGLVYIMDAGTGELVLSAMQGLDPEEWALERLRSGESLPGLAAQSGRVLRSVDVTRDGRVRQRQRARELGLGAAIVAPLISQGRVVGVLALYRRATGRFSDEDERLLVSLAANAAMAIENANLAREGQRRTEFVSGLMSEVNHRMRNSLQMIIGMLRMEVERTGGRSPEEVVRRAISHIQAVAAVQDAIREPEVYLVDVKEVAQRVASLHQGLREHHIDVQVTGTRVMLPSQRAIHVALVLNELVDNAIRHGFAGAEGGRITISLAVGGGEIVLQVRDTGVGAPKDANLEAGRGLGLRIVRGLVEQELGGRVEFESRNGFTVRARFPKLD